MLIFYGIINIGAVKVELPHTQNASDFCKNVYCTLFLAGERRTFCIERWVKFTRSGETLSLTCLSFTCHSSFFDLVTTYLKSTLNTSWLSCHSVSLFPDTYPALFLVQQDNQEGTCQIGHDQKLPDYGACSCLFTTSVSHFNYDNKSIFDNNNFLQLVSTFLSNSQVRVSPHLQKPLHTTIIS
jgi:hypothetical protein